MSQPSANVDAVIFCWAQAELAALAPAAIHQRDCFAAAWSPSASEALFVSNHLQVCIGAKLTASLQLTDTDWSRAFKTLCRSEMESLRLAGQQALQKSGSAELWKSSHLDMAKTVVAAQSEMARRLDDKDWILQGLRRNGMLAYRPDWTLQKLVPLSDDDCGGQAMGFLSSAHTFFFCLGSNYSSILPKTPTSDTRVSLRLLARWRRPWSQTGQLWLARKLSATWWSGATGTLQTLRSRSLCCLLLSCQRTYSCLAWRAVCSLCLWTCSVLLGEGRPLRAARSWTSSWRKGEAPARQAG